jgi:hypothetical protein
MRSTALCLFRLFASWPMFQRDATHSGRVHDASTDGQLLSLSTRALAGSGKNLIAGFIVQGSGSKFSCCAASGPRWPSSSWPIRSPIRRSPLRNFPSGLTARQRQLGLRRRWQQIIAATATVGAFHLPVR